MIRMLNTAAERLMVGDRLFWRGMIQPVTGVARGDGLPYPVDMEWVCVRLAHPGESLPIWGGPTELVFPSGAIVVRAAGTQVCDCGKGRYVIGVINGSFLCENCYFEAANGTKEIGKAFSPARG